MALTKVLTGGIALDAVDNTILKLDDNYALTGTVTGAGGLQLLFSQTTAVNAASIDIDDTYINSTYDSYYVICNIKPVSDAIQWYLKLKSSGSIVTGSKHCYDVTNGGNGSLHNTSDFIRMNFSTIGNAVGEGVQCDFFLHSVNSTIYTTRVGGFWRDTHTDGAMEGGMTSGGFISTEHALVCNGFNIAASSGDLDTHSIKVYGVV